MSKDIYSEQLRKIADIIAYFREHELKAKYSPGQMDINAAREIILYLDD